MTRPGARRRAEPVNPIRGLLPLAALLVLWQLIGNERSVTMPPPGQWLAALARMHATGVLVPAVATTLATYLAALGVATLVGVVLGTAIGASRRIDRALSPLLDVVATVPGAAMVPLTLLLLGITYAANVTVVVLVIIWPILHNTTSAMRTIPTVRLDLARTLRLTTLDRWRKIVLPSLAPDVLVGVRVASSLALIITLLADLLGTAGGIGIQLEISSASFDAAGAWGLLLVIGAIGYLASRAIAGLERRVLHYLPQPGA
jgi:sulfonate transport system permease protein